MSNQSTSPDVSGDVGIPEPDYRAKYDGLQRAFQSKTNEWAREKQTLLDQQSAYEARIAKVAEYEAQVAAAAEEAEALARYERDRQRFEPEPPTPLQHADTRERSGGDRDVIKAPSQSWP